MTIINEKKNDNTIVELEIIVKREDCDFSFLNKYPNVKKLIVKGSGINNPEQIKSIKKNSNVEIIINDTLFLDLKKYSQEKGFIVMDWPYSYINYKGINVKPIVEPPIESALNYPKIEIYAYSLDDMDVDVACNFYNETDERLRKDLRIIFSNGDTYKILFDKSNKISNIFAKTNSFEDVRKVVKFFIKKGYKLDNICVTLRDTNYCDIDTTIFDDIKNDVNITVNYGELHVATLEEFEGLQASVNWYRKIINDTDLSPLEKVMFAYDILKTFEYKENDEKKEESRYAHLIISTGNIVCVGYANLLKEILNNLNDNINVSSFGCTCYDKNHNFRGGHQRSLIRVKDDKYGVNGIYACDVTWDSDKSRIIKNEMYNALDLYQYFMIPRNLYKSVFPYDTVPDIFKYDTGEGFYAFKVVDNCRELFPSRVDDKDRFISDYNEIIKDEELIKYLDVPRPSLDMFNEMLLNVRMAEGYTKEEAMKEVEKVYLLNKKVIELSAANDKEIPFFEDNIVKK